MSEDRIVNCAKRLVKKLESSAFYKLNGEYPKPVQIEIGRMVSHCKKYTEAEPQGIVQEKLRQQREACADAYIEHDEGYAHVVEAIMDATIDNNGEEW